MTLSMSRCIGRAGCVNSPTAGRGLCMTCYVRHKNNETLKNFPTMRERTAALRARGLVPPAPSSTETSRRWRDKKHAERVYVQGVLVHENAPHGEINGYISYGCRGALCNAARRYYRATGITSIPRDVRGDNPTAVDCVEFDVETFVGAYL